MTDLLLFLWRNTKSAARLLPSDVSFVVISQQRALLLRQHPTPQCAARTKPWLKILPKKQWILSSGAQLHMGLNLYRCAWMTSQWRQQKKKRKIQPAACEDRMKRIISHLHCQRIYFKTQAKRIPSEIMIGFVSSVQGYKGLIKAKFSITINDSPSAPSKSRSRQSLARLISWAHGEP